MNIDTIARDEDATQLRRELLDALLAAGTDAPEELATPASYEQQRMWYSSRIEGAGSAYNLCNAMSVPAALPTALLERCFAFMLERHALLRACFVERDGAPELQPRPLASCGFTFRRTQADGNAHEPAVVAALDEERRHLFDLARDCLIRVHFIERSGGGGTLVVNVHHIVTDTWSLGYFAQEFAEVVPALAAGREPNLPPLRARYGDYSLWQADWLRRDEASAQRRYWRRQLQDVTPLTLAASAPRPGKRSWSGASERLALDSAVVAGLDQLQRDCGLTRFAVLSAAVAISLHAFGAAPDIALGSSVSTRRDSVLEPVFGLFLNQIVLRFDLSGNPELRRFLADAARVTRDAFTRRELPFGEVVATVDPTRDATRSPLFDALISLQNTPRSALQGEVVDVPVQPTIDSAKFDLSFFFEEHGGRLGGQLVYSTRLFGADIGRRLAECVVEVLRRLPNQLDVPISKFRNSLRSASAVQADSLDSSPSASRFKRGVRKPINLADMRRVDEQALDGRVPYVYQALDSALDVPTWLDDQREAIDARLAEFGAVLLRGMQLGDVGRFAAVVERRCRQVIAGYGDLPEEKGTDRVYGSTPYPNDRRILFHSEGSHMATWPLHQFFACVTPSPTGGETPIVDVRRIYQQLDPALRERFHTQGLRYVRHFIPGLDVPWQAFFKTSDPAAVERLCRDNGDTIQWKHDGILMLARHAQAVACHPATGAWSFFNQIMLHHPYFLRPEEREALVSLHGEANMPRLVTWGDGTPFDESLLAELLALYERESVAFPWQQGDLLMLDNMSIAHARNPFSGPRKIIVGMGDPVHAGV